MATSTSKPATTATSSQPAQPLTFSPSHFARLAPSDFLHASLNSPTQTRPNGRKTTQPRTPSINTGSLTNANGSAVVRLGSTSVVCGVRAELLPISHIHGGLPSDLEAWQSNQSPSTTTTSTTTTDGNIIADLRLLVPNLELSTGCNGAHLPGNAPSAEAQGLTQRILALLRTADLVSLRPLVVWYKPEVSAEGNGDGGGDGEMVDEGEDEGRGAEREIKALWTLYVDILFISLDGCAFDAAWLAVLAALRDTVLPRTWWDEDVERCVSSPVRDEATGLELRDLPVVLTAGVFSCSVEGKVVKRVLYDPDDFEEGVCKGRITVVVARDSKRKAKGRLLRVEASGKGVELTDVSAVAKAAEERWKFWLQALNWNS